MIPFTQFFYPNRRRAPGGFDRPPEVEAKAEELIAAGYRFECEVLPPNGPAGGQVHIDCAHPGDDNAISLRIAPNDERVLAAVDELVAEAHERAQWRCEFCGGRWPPVAVLEADPDQLVCGTCHDDERIPTREMP